MVPLKYLSSFWRTIEMSLINCELNLIINWYKGYAIFSKALATTFVLTDATFYVPVVALLPMKSCNTVTIKIWFQENN